MSPRYAVFVVPDKQIGMLREYPLSAKTDRSEILMQDEGLAPSDVRILEVSFRDITDEV